MVTIKRFEREFEIETYERKEKGKTLSIIPHKSLEKLFNDMKAIRSSLTYTVKPVMISENRVVFEGQISDGDQIYLPEIGESCASTLKGDVAESYPVLIAHQRAFDRAFISYLNLSGRLYSDIEIIDAEKDDDEEKMDEDIFRPAIFRDEYVPASMKKGRQSKESNNEEIEEVSDPEEEREEVSNVKMSAEDAEFFASFENTNVPITGYGKVKEAPIQALQWFANTMTDSDFGTDLRRYLELREMQ